MKRTQNMPMSPRSEELERDLVILEAVIRENYGNDVTLNENQIGEILGCGRQTIAQIRRRAFRKLRSKLNQELLEFGTDPKTLRQV